MSGSTHCTRHELEAKFGGELPGADRATDRWTIRSPVLALHLYLYDRLLDESPATTATTPTATTSPAAPATAVLL